MLDSSVNSVCVWSTKKLTMPAYCVAVNCNNSQMTPGITMHELPCNWPTVRWKWIKFIQFKWADFLTAPHHAHLCSEHFSECDFTNPMEYCMSCDMTLSKSCLTGSNWYGCILVGLSGKVSVSSSEPKLAILQQLPSDIVGIWSRDLGVMAMLSVQQKMPFFRAFITLRSQFHLHHRSQRALTEIVSKITPNLGLVL